MGVAQAQHVAVVCPHCVSGPPTVSFLTVIEHPFDGRVLQGEAQLSQHCGQYVPRECGLDDIGSVQTIDAAAVRPPFAHGAHFVLNAPVCSRMTSA